eukprot:scaffold13069_cov18-Tisochrysis_lutea.AAC.1
MLVPVSLQQAPHWLSSTPCSMQRGASGVVLPHCPGRPRVDNGHKAAPLQAPAALVGEQVEGRMLCAPAAVIDSLHPPPPPSAAAAAVVLPPSVPVVAA